MLTITPLKKMLAVTLLALSGIVVIPAWGQQMTVATAVPRAQVHRKVEVKPAHPSAPAWYVEQQGDNSSSILAFTAQGLPAWSWPAARSEEKAQLEAGTPDGGVVVYTSRKAKRFVVSLDWRGHERWRIPTAGFKTSVQAPDGIFYFVEDTGHSAEVVALDGAGKTKFRTPLPMSALQHLNYDLANDDAYLICRPGISMLTELPSAHGDLSLAADGTLELTVASIHQTFDGMPCAPNRRINTSKSAFNYDGKLQLLRFRPSGSYSAVTLKEFSYTGPDWNHNVELAEPSGACVHDSNGDVLTAGRWLIFRPQTGETVAQTQMIYHLHYDEVGEYALPLAADASTQDSHLLLGEDGTAFLSSGTTVVAFDPESGSVRWKWTTKQPSVRTLSARAGGGVTVVAGSETVFLDGKGHPALPGRP